MGVEEIRLINRGGFGVVHEVALDGVRVARKTYQPVGGDDTPELRRRFRREVRIQGAIEHPNVLPVYATAQDLDGATPCFYMPLAEYSLEERLPKLGEQPHLDLQLWGDLLSGVEEIHRLTLVHRDLKPANILWLGDRWAIGDFGHVLDGNSWSTRVTRTNAGFFSLYYSAPELPHDAKYGTVEADIYSLGCILWHLRTPGGRRVAFLPSDLDGPFGVVVSKATAHHPRDRYANIAEFRAALFAAIEEDKSYIGFPLELNDLLALVRKNEASPDDWTLILESLPTADSSTRDTAFRQFTTVPLLLLEQRDRFLFSRVVRALCDWVVRTQFEWAYCDVIADRFGELWLSLTPQDKPLMCLSLLEMAVQHNRWHAMRVLLHLINDCDGGVIARLCMIIRSDADVRQGFRFVHRSLAPGSAPWNAEILALVEVK